MNALKGLTGAAVQGVRRLRADQWPVVGGLIRQAGRLWNRRVFPDGLPACVDGKVTLRLSPQSFSGGAYAFDPKLTEEMRAVACAGRHFIDAGAHMGICSLMYAQLAGGDTRVAAFEPNPNVFPLLYENVRCNDLSVFPFPVVLGDRVGEVPFYTSGRDPNASLSREAPGKYWYWKNRPKPMMKEYRVRMTTIDRFCEAFDFTPGLLKLDVEGAELQVLRGAAHTLQRHRPLVLLETHAFAWESFGYGAKALEDFIRSAGYSIFRPNGAPLDGALGSGPEQDNNHFLLRPK